MFYKITDWAHRFLMKWASTGGRRPSKVSDLSVEQMFPELSRYYNQTFLSDSVTQSALRDPPTPALDVMF